MTRRLLPYFLALALVAGMTAVVPVSAASNRRGDQMEQQKKKKKKKPKPSPSPEACPAYTPGELGADAPIVVVTDTATEEAPATQEVELELSAADFVIVTDPSTAFFNVQVDTANPDAGLWGRFTFPTRRDYDLYFRHAVDGSEAASSHGFNTLVEAGSAPIFSQGNGQQSTANSETITGLRTADCAGYTVEAQNWFGEGGTFAIELWLGEAMVDPLPPGG